MVRDQLAGRGIRDGRVLATMRVVPRHLFVEPSEEGRAYEDGPLPIGFGATISQPYVVAAMTELLRLRGTEKVLEIGSGSGYQTAVLAELAGEVYSVEIVPELHERAKRVLEVLGYRNVHLRCGDGARGWLEEAPFDDILVTAAPPDVPSPLLDQLALGGRMVIPIGKERQTLHVFEKTPKGMVREKSFEVRFVPLQGKGEKPPPAAP
jgi:protein-L-isoaspartate(D-aspartate) O-methyltransferase